MSVEFEMHNFRETVLAQTRKNQKYAKNVGCRKVTKNSAERCLYNVDWNQCRTRWKSVNEIAIDFASNPGAVFDAFGDRWSETTKYVLLVAYNTFSTNR